MARIFRACLVASGFFFFWTASVLLAWIVLPLVLVWQRDPKRRMVLAQRVLRTGFRIFHAYLRHLGLFDVALTGPVARPDGAPVVLIANHVTLVDVTAIVANYPNICCVAKASMAENPLFGSVLRHCGFISAGRGAFASMRVLDEAAIRLRDGFDVLIFPEGTRAPPGELRRFHRGAFELACRTGASIMPFVLRCSPPALMKGLPFWKHPSTMSLLTIAPGEPVSPAAFDFDARSLSEFLHKVYKRALGIEHGA